MSHKDDAYSLRPIEQQDLPLVLQWRNSPKVHGMMLTDHQISWEEHCAWFARQKQQQVKRNLIFEYHGRSVGYVGYTQYDEQQGSCSPGAYLGVDEELPPEVALGLFYACVDYAFTHLKMRSLCTDVFADNKKALKLDRLLGYELNPALDHLVLKDERRRLTHRLTLTQEKWQRHKERFVKYFSCPGYSVRT